MSWSGSDDPGGSGIAKFDIFVSTDGGPFVPFLQGTTATSATFHGAVGHTYGFYSVATDNVGHVQVTPTAAQATTKAVAPTLSISGAGTATAGTPYTLTLAASGPGSDTISGWTVTWGDGVVQAIDGNPTSVTHLYATPGAYTIGATATTAAGTFAAGNTVLVTVSAAPPVTTPTPGGPPPTTTPGGPTVTPPSGFGPGRDAFVTTLYREILDRPAEPRGLRFWARRLAAGCCRGAWPRASGSRRSTAPSCVNTSLHT